MADRLCVSVVLRGQRFLLAHPTIQVTGLQLQLAAQRNPHSRDVPRNIQRAPAAFSINDGKAFVIHDRLRQPVASAEAMGPDAQDFVTTGQVVPPMPATQSTLLGTVAAERRNG
jgi:hypothetical protein